MAINQTFEGPGKIIQLTKGYITVVDAEDYPILSTMHWFANVRDANYVRAARQSQRQMIYMHAQIIGYVPLGYEIDHKNRNPLDNRRANLRIVTHLENMQNSARAVYRIGVSYNWRANSWMAYLDRPNKPRKYLGYRKSKDAALQLVEEARNAMD